MYGNMTTCVSANKSGKGTHLLGLGLLMHNPNVAKNRKTKFISENGDLFNLLPGFKPFIKMFCNSVRCVLATSFRLLCAENSN